MSEIKYWSQNKVEAIEAGWVIEFTPYNTSEKVFFDTKNLSSIEIELNGRTILPCRCIDDLKVFSEVIGMAHIAPFFKFCNGVVFIDLSDAMHDFHISIRVKAISKGFFNFYQEQAINTK